MPASKPSDREEEFEFIDMPNPGLAAQQYQSQHNMNQQEAQYLLSTVKPSAKPIDLNGKEERKD